MSLQDEMIQYRARERITQQELANRCGMSKQYIYRIETGKVKPSKVSEAKIKIVIEKENE